eukprot:gb/GECG01002964.1/.p1 GENE.gb/GECG01002964.1/~~gb/GECG01002964.1/.p1  ORF type:complete len:130 (+),score=10.38 gb/GECG01002964.1/:1-390(+)
MDVTPSSFHSFQETPLSHAMWHGRLLFPVTTDSYIYGLRLGYGALVLSRRNMENDEGLHLADVGNAGNIGTSTNDPVALVIYSSGKSEFLFQPGVAVCCSIRKHDDRLYDICKACHVGREFSPPNIAVL